METLITSPVAKKNPSKFCKQTEILEYLLVTVV